MKIVLVRHGRPACALPARVRTGELARWIDVYNDACLDAQSQPPAALVDIATGCNAVVCSHLRRSTESARALGCAEIRVCDSLFRELELPYLKLPSPALPPLGWFIFFRMLWVLGLSTNGESRGVAQQRARTAAKRLQELAATGGSVLFVGHGLLNRLLARELLAAGWRGPADPGRQHWSYGVYRMPER